MKMTSLTALQANFELPRFRSYACSGDSPPAMYKQEKLCGAWEDNTTEISMKKPPLSQREFAVASILTTVLTQNVKHQKATVPLIAIYQGIPQPDLNWLKSGVAALIDLDMLGMRGNEIGVTDGGKAYLDFFNRFEPDPKTPEEIEAHATPSPKLDALRLSMSRDVRFEPPPSARGANIPSAPTPLGSREKSMWNFWTVSFVLFMVYCVGSFLYAAGKAAR